jgi:hypothetical protein
MVSAANYAAMSFTKSRALKTEHRNSVRDKRDGYRAQLFTAQASLRRRASPL